MSGLQPNKMLLLVLLHSTSGLLAWGFRPGTGLCASLHDGPLLQTCSWAGGACVHWCCQLAFGWDTVGLPCSAWTHS